MPIWWDQSIHRHGSTGQIGVAKSCWKQSETPSLTRHTGPTVDGGENGGALFRWYASGPATHTGTGTPHMP